VHYADRIAEVAPFNIMLEYRMFMLEHFGQGAPDFPESDDQSFTVIEHHPSMRALATPAALRFSRVAGLSLSWRGKIESIAR
jgi:hypothetical protein